MYGVAGERRLDEYTATWLSGYDGNPVRIGNAAAEQFQLDVYGEVMDALHQGRRAGLKVDDPAWAPAGQADGLRRGALDGPGRGHLGGARRPPAVRALQADGVGGGRPAVKAVEEFVLDGRSSGGPNSATPSVTTSSRRGTTPSKTFTQFSAPSELDAALLMIPLVGFLPATDERVLGTVAAIEAHLMLDGFVAAYTQHPDTDVDGLPRARVRSSLVRSGWPATTR
jgi:GH15 family glucan-1,4-alpha-glucosidase